MIRRPPRSTLSSSSAASDVYKRQVSTQSTGILGACEMVRGGKLRCDLSSTAAQLAEAAAELTLSRLDCHCAAHTPVLLRKGTAIRGDMVLSRVSGLEDGAKLILFLHHPSSDQPQQRQNHDNSLADRHVAVLRLVGNCAWDVRVVGGNRGGLVSSITSTVLSKLAQGISNQGEALVTVMEASHGEFLAAEQELAEKRSEIEQANRELAMLSDKVTKKQQQLASLSRQEVGGLVEDTIQMLEKQMAHLESELHSDTRSSLMCSVCYSKPFVYVFQCGHAKCDECANRLLNESRGCPECREPLEDPRRLFWPGVG
eukprot:TRINITY_DN2750_c0_g1_i1.p1 TRINITY_DN2750_c0_g1~~TRINITY_DN2750_c0_g1_i1.p1  ORF type:complete len:314 (-),score=67.35 TRINITY_DN2750_c0_g1_i1:384-1325(-)